MLSSSIELSSGNLRSHVGVAELVTGIWNRPETYQQEFVGVVGCNRTSSFVTNFITPTQTSSHPHKLHHTHTNFITPTQTSSHPHKLHHTHTNFITPTYSVPPLQ